MSDFKNSQEAAFRRVIRDMIKRGPFTKSERDVVLAFFNHWFVHRNGEKGFVHPGRKKLAKRAQVTIKTVSRTLAMLRDNHAIQPVGHLNGLHGNATEYTVSIEALRLLCEKSKADLRITVGQMSRPKGGTKCPAVYGKVIIFPNQRKA